MMDIEDHIETKEPDPGGGGDNSEMEFKDDEDLAGQLAQLQGIVHEMKDGFTSALKAMGEVQYGDRILQEKVDNNKAEQEEQLADVVNMVLALKTEFGGVVSQLQLATESQRILQKQVEQLQYEKDILLEELETTGAINQSLREKYHSGKNRPNDLHRMNETSLGVLLERARHAFNTTNHNTSDHDSGVTAGEVTPPVMSPIVQSYIAGLQNHAHVEEIPPQENYDSDSSLTQAANRSLDLSRSLGDKCAEITQGESSGEEDEVEKERQEDLEIEKEDECETKVDDESKVVDEEPVHIVDLQASPSSGSSSSPLFKRPQSPRKTPPHERNTKDLLRTRIARELVETERKYCSSLWTILDHFAGPLKHANLVATRDAMTMFPPCLTQMYEHHCTFLQRLEERTINWKWQGLVGDVLQRAFDPNQSDLLRQYESYISEFPSALHQVKKSVKNSVRFKRFLRKRQADPCCEGLDLGAYLLTPVQRIPRYVLLLKQLMKHTEPDHPDYFYIESVLQRLADFLTELNDSIQYSMEVVANDTTPKLKKKSRPAWRSSSISSFDVTHSSTKDSGIDNNSVVVERKPRLMRIPRDQRRHTTIVCPTESTPIPNNGGYSNDLIASPICTLPRPSGGTPLRERDRTFAGTDSNTLPVRKLKHQRQRRPKSGGVLLGHVKRAEELNNLMAETDQCERLQSSFKQNGNLENSFNLRNNFMDNSLNPLQEDPTTRHLNSSVYLDHSYSNNNAEVSQYLGASIKSLPEGSQGPVRPDQRSELFKSMPGIPNNGGKDYGIFGDNDELDETLYHPSAVNHDSLSRKMQLLGINQRSKSHGDMLQDGSDSPSQQQIALSLAQSLTDERLNETDLSQIISSRPQSRVGQPYVNKKISDPNSSFSSQGSQRSQQSVGQGQHKINGSRPKSAVSRPPMIPDQQRKQRPKSAIFPNATMKPSLGRDNMWGNDSTIDNSVLNSPGLNATVNGASIDRRGRKKKKKDKNDKVLDNLNVTTVDGHKKKGIRDSLKNIFFKKRSASGNKVVEINTDQSGDYINVPVSAITRVNITDGTNTKPAPEGAIHVTRPGAKTNHGAGNTEVATKLTLSTYEDENGDPCSAV